MNIFTEFSTSSAIGGISSPDPHHDHPTKIRNYQTTFPGDYIEMNMDNQNQMENANIPKPSSAEPVFALQEVQSYISNSSESCWTPNSSNTNRSEIQSTAANAPRAYSLGSRPVNIGGSSASNSKAGSSEIERIPSTSLMPSQQLLHPCANSNSPPNYLKKTILGQTVKNMMSKEIIENLGSKNDEQNKQEKQQNTKKGEEEENTMDELMNAEVRKRAYSVGSKTWLKTFLLLYKNK